METKKIIQLSLVTTLLVSCGDSSNKQDNVNDREVQESNNPQRDANAPIITLKG
jgi:hypothetical protein